VRNSNRKGFCRKEAGQLKKLCILLPAIVCLLTACNIDLSKIRTAQLDALTNEERPKIQQMSKDIIECFTEKNKEALKNLFCEQTRNRPNFDDEIDQAFEFFVCDFYIGSNIDDHASGGESMESGERVHWYVFPDIPYIHTIADTEGDPSAPMEDLYYRIGYYWKIIHENKSLEGLQYLEIELLNVGSTEIGEIIDYLN
jgi:hypothetical protein